MTLRTPLRTGSSTHSNACSNTPAITFEHPCSSSPHTPSAFEASRAAPGTARADRIRSRLRWRSARDQTLRPEQQDDRCRIRQRAEIDIVRPHRQRIVVKGQHNHQRGALIRSNSSEAVRQRPAPGLTGERRKPLGTHRTSHLLPDAFKGLPARDKSLANAAKPANPVAVCRSHGGSKRGFCARSLMNFSTLGRKDARDGDARRCWNSYFHWICRPFFQIEGGTPAFARRPDNRRSPSQSRRAPKPLSTSSTIVVRCWQCAQLSFLPA